MLPSRESSFPGNTLYTASRWRGNARRADKSCPWCCCALVMKNNSQKRNNCRGSGERNELCSQEGSNDFRGAVDGSEGTVEFADVGDVKKCKGKLSLVDAKLEESQRKQFCFAIAKQNRTYLFAAKNEKEQQEWVDMLNACIKSIQLVN